MFQRVCVIAVGLVFLVAAVHDPYRPGAAFYAFLTLLKGEKRVFAVLSHGDYEEVARDAGVPTCVLDRRPTVNIKLKAVLARDALPEVLLITNRCSQSSSLR